MLLKGAVSRTSRNWRMSQTSLFAFDISSDVFLVINDCTETFKVVLRLYFQIMVLYLRAYTDWILRRTSSRADSVGNN